MSRPEVHDPDLPSGAREYHHSNSLSDRSLGVPSSPFAPFIPRSSVVAPESAFNRPNPFPMHDPYGGPTRGNSRGSLGIPYQGSFLVPAHPPFAAQEAVVRSPSIGYPFGNPPATAPYSPYNDREHYAPRPPSNNKPQPPPLPPSVVMDPRNTLWWGDLEPWMDEEYAKQVCTIMNWDPAHIKVPRPPPDSVTGQQANNPGHCFLSFASQAQAAAVLNQMHNKTVIMPNSSKPFVLSWAPSVPSSSPAPPFVPPPPPVPRLQPQLQPQQSQPQPFLKEYSIFVGDLAPEVSNSDLVAVFRNPVLGLRNDREPRFIRPFLSCKSSKIMLDPVTGVSRGYGFVRFTDELDQQRALIEMHGLYCLSRPMRISPATAKYKLSASGPPVEFESALDVPETSDQQLDPTPSPSLNSQAQSVSAPLATNQANSQVTSTSSTSTPPGQSRSYETPSEDRKAPNGSNNGITRTPSNNNSLGATSVGKPEQQPAQRYVISEESWKHHAQARAILSNLIGPNGEQLSSSDPYNTTVFVGGLSPLISEDTLRTFFVPFGEIHYVKVPAGKNCGFVQFIRKPDAERAIEKMQGFPIGGSRIRLSWGRSQYKAAQAAAQAAQTAALQSETPYSQPVQPQHAQPPQQQQQQQQPNTPSQSHSPQSQQPNQMPISPEQALELIKKLGLTRFLNNPEPSLHATGDHYNALHRNEDQLPSPTDRQFSQSPGGAGSSIDAQIMRSHMFNNFSPFSPDPNVYIESRDGPMASRSGKASPVASPTNTGPSGATASTAKPNGASTQPRFSFYEANRSSSRPDSHMQRTSPPRNMPPGHEYERRRAPDNIQDLNGTLASLDLDNQQQNAHQQWRQVVNSSRTPPSA